jgi:hypothetical protein
MKIKLIQTKESDGNWYKIYADADCKACFKIYEGEEIKSFKRAMEVFDFLLENKGGVKVIKEETV